MDETTPVNEKVHLTTLTLANAGMLASVIIKNIAGNDISNAVNGSTLTREMINTLVCRRLVQKRLAA